MNIKENWSVVNYLGETLDGCMGLTKGRYYYWPCSIETPEYEGVIDDERQRYARIEERFTDISYATSL